MEDAAIKMEKDTSVSNRKKHFAKDRRIGINEQGRMALMKNIQEMKAAGQLEHEDAKSNNSQSLNNGI